MRFSVEAEVGRIRRREESLRTEVAAEAGHGGKVCSFDVFETLLVRTVGSPDAVFLLLGRRLVREKLIVCSPGAFAAARVEAGRRATRNHGSGCTLTLIYRELGASLQFDDDVLASIKERELALEAELIRAVPGAAERVCAARESGARIVFVSDMYLPSEFIRRLLTAHNLFAEGDELYVSCEHGAWKASGDLFRIVLERQSVRPPQVTHIGNHEPSDVSAPRRLGLRAEHFPNGNLNRFERILESFSHSTDGLASAMAGASRLARLATHAEDGRQVVIRDVAAGVVAPMIVGYALWVLNRAKHSGISRLFFLSREGQVLLNVARDLNARLGLGLKLEYLYSSRRAWSLPVTQGIGDKWIWRSSTVSVRKLFRRLALDPEPYRERLEAAGISHDHWCSPLDDRQTDLLRDVLSQDGVHRSITEKSAQQRALLLEDLVRHRVFDKAEAAIVDFGSSGTLQRALEILAEGSGLSAPQGYYFCIVDGPSDDNRRAYLLDKRTSEGHLGALVGRYLFTECFFAGDHGTVLEFQKVDGAIEPVLEVERNKHVLDWGLPMLRQTVANFTAMLELDETLVEPWADVRGAILAVLDEFHDSPSTAEARVWGEFPWEDEDLDGSASWRPLAEPYSGFDLMSFLLRGRPSAHHPARWSQGSLEASRALPRGIIRFVLRGRRYASRKRS